MEMQTSVYNIIWVDDDIDTLVAPVETKRLLKSKRINVIKAHNAIEFRATMDLCYDRVDAVITDANFSKTKDKPISERDLSGFEDIKSCIEKYQSKRVIPFYLYSGRGEFLAERYEFEGMEYFQINKRSFSKGELPKLLDQLRIEVEHINSPSFRIRNKYQHELEAASLVEGNEEALFNALMYEYSEDWKETADYFNPARKIVERIFVQCKKLNILPGLTELNAFSSFLSGSNDIFEVVEGVEIMSKPLVRSLEYFLNITQDGSHGAGDLKLGVDSYVRKTKNINLFRTVLYIAMDICLWYAKYISENPDPNVNSTKWRIKNNCIFEHQGIVKLKNDKYVCDNYSVKPAIDGAFEVGDIIGIKKSIPNKFIFTYFEEENEITVDKFALPNNIVVLSKNNQ